MGRAVETTTFRLVSGASLAGFVAANVDMTQWLRGQSGFLARDIGMDVSGTVVELAYWTSPDDARAAVDRMLDETRDSPVHRMIDTATVEWRIAELADTPGRIAE